MNISKKAIILLLVSSFTLSLSFNVNAEEEFDLSILTDLLNDDNITSDTWTYTNEAEFKKFNQEEENITIWNDETWIEFNSAWDVNIWTDDIEVNGNAPYPEYDDIEMNSAWTNAVTSDYVNPNWNNLSSVNTWQQLPKTWPEHFLLFLLSMIIVWVVFYKRKFK